MQAGDMISKRYVLLEKIGTGGMSEVFKAEDKQKKRIVTLKILLEKYRSDSEVVRRFKREGVAASKMSHENIVELYDVGSDGDIQYLVKEYVEGKTLKQMISEQGRLPAEKVVKYTLRILAALDHAHKNGIIHRDIKPQNILVDQQDTIKVTDFGIARLLDASTGTLSDSQTALGTVQYMSPEQANGENTDARSDLYSVGIVMYEMLTGVMPFKGDNAVAVAMKQMNEMALSMRGMYKDIPQSFEDIVFKAIEKQPGRRYQTARAMAKDVSKALKYPKGGYVNRFEDAERTLGDVIRSYMNTLLTALTVIVVLAIIIYGFFKVRDILYGVDVPSTTGLTVTEACRLIEQQGMESVISEQYSYEAEKGIVLSQSPEGGSRSRRNLTVELTVSAGSEPKYMPSTVGMTRKEALELLSENGFRSVYIVYDCDENEELDVVLSQSPDNGQAQYGDAVTLTVNSVRVAVPLLTGKTRAQAQSILETLGLTVEFVTGYTADDAADTVVMQDLPAGTLLKRGSSVKLYVTATPARTYCADYNIKVPLSVNVRVLLTAPSGQSSEVYSADAAMDEIIRLNLEGTEAGTYTVTVLYDGVTSSVDAVEFQ